MSLSRSEPGAAGTLAERPDFRLGSHLVRPSVNRVSTPAGDVQVEPKIMQVLVCLADARGRTVSKQRLFDEVWGGVYVTEDVLTRAIGELRRTLGDDSARPAYIETIRKTGYRLIPPPEPAAPDGPAAAAAAPARISTRGAASPRRLVPILLAILLALAVLFLLARGAAPDRRAEAPMRLRTLTALPGAVRDPAVSPDASRVAFAWNGGAGGRFSLYVQLVDSESPLRVTSVPDVEDRLPAWSSDGQRLAFTRVSPSGCRVVLVSALGGPERDLAACGDGEYRHMTWSPDGKWLARAVRAGGGGATGAEGEVRLELLSPDTLESRIVTRPPAGIVGDSSASFSPDGRTIAFARNFTDGVSDLYRIGADGSGERRLTFDSRDLMGVDWIDGGRSILFSSSRAGIYSLWKVPSDGGEPSWVAGGGAKMKHPSTARARNVVAFENWVYAVNLWRIPLDGGAPRRLTEAGDEWNYAPRLSPDGSRVAFVSTRSGAAEIWTASSEGGTPRKLTSFGGARLESPRWSPDGRRIAFTGRREGPASLYAIDADGAVPQQLAGPELDPAAPEWSRDGRGIYFGSRRGGDWQVWKLDLASRHAAAVTRSGGYAAQESPDGRWLYTTRPGVRGLWREPVGEGGRSEKVADLAPEDWENWLVTARGVYVRDSSGHAPKMTLLPFDPAGPAADVAPLADQGWSGFAMAPDGSFLVYPRVDRHACDIRLLENTR